MGRQVTRPGIRSVAPAAALLSLALALAAPLAHGQTYKWVDANGKTHYSDAPPDSGKTKVDVVNTPPPAEASPKTPNWEEEERAFQRRRLARGDARPAVDPRPANCQQARFTLRQMDGKRVYRTGRNGERIYMEDSERATIEERARQTIERDCPR
jgi:uncharacterized protein DUF4124